MRLPPHLPFDDELEAAIAAPVNPHHHVRRDDPETSYLAAFEHPTLRTSHRWRCYLVIYLSGPRGLTDAELAVLVGIQLNSANKRRGELRDAGLVVDSGRRRLTPAGSEAIVWVAV